jgi:hypothetical protein
MASSDQGSQRSIGHLRITGRSFTSTDPERQREIVTDNTAVEREPNPFATRSSKPPHMAWMAPEVDSSEGGSSRRNR